MKRTILLLSLALDVAGAANAERRYVKTDGTGSTASATTWATASNDLQAVIMASIAGDEIRVTAGTYKPLYKAAATDDSSNPTTDRDKAFVLKRGVKIYGGFTAFTDGGAIPAFGSTDRNGVSTLSGDIDNTPADITGNAYHVVIGARLITAATVLDGFTVTGGNADGSGSSITVNGGTCYRRDGGGIYNSDSSSPALTNLTVSGNTATERGGGIYNYLSSPTLINVTISGNSASSNGGGIYNSYSSPTLTNVTVSGNTANNGGGIYSHSNGTLTLQNSIVSGNTTPDAPDCWVYNAGGTFINASYSLIGNTAHSSGKDVTQVSNCIVDTDPQFVDWQNPASVVMPNTDGDYRLSATSPAINTGYDTYNSESKDLAGNPCLAGVIDMGAYEYQTPTPGVGGKVYVKKGSTGNGSSWTNACGELAVALYEAQTNTAIHEIWVAAGTYKPLYKAGDGITNRDKAFVFVEGVKIYGGFPADANDATHINILTRGLNPLLNATILSGDIDNTPADISGNAYHVVIGAAIANDGATVLDGFTVTGGNADVYIGEIIVNGGYFYRHSCGGIYNATSFPTLANVTVSENSAIADSGGIYTSDDLTTPSGSYTNCLFAGNTANRGGAFFYYQAGIGAGSVFTNCTFAADNTSPNGNIFAYYKSGSGSALRFLNCIIDKAVSETLF